mgnify:CR=1 FL=1
MAANSHPDRPDVSELVYQQTALTFEEDKVVIEAQYKNMLRFPGAPQIDIHVDAGPNRARRVVERLTKGAAAPAPLAAPGQAVAA